ncbi:DUF2569 domain-containing protein [Chitinophaga niabensis]|uniref:DUF2569 domain-containing protein n=1 Tax=Chitinophaga niabensis TaxID=536979 RepID=UPI00135631B7|nr:DUF2569 domain-containing protein [Chitinophaga niabensis]
MKNLKTSYEDFYKKIYGKVELLDSILITDLTEENKIKVEEKYRIEEPWKIDSANNNRLSFTSSAHILKDKIIIVNESRKKPVTLLFPNELKYTISLKFPEPWALDAKAYTLDSKYYTFTFTPVLNNKIVSLKYDFEAKSDHIPAEGMKKYIKDMDELVNSTGYVFSYDPSRAAKGNAGPSGINWLVLFLAFASGAFFIYLAAKYYKRSVPQLHSTDEAWAIGGWLALLGIGVVIRPVLVIIGLFQMETFRNSVWAGLSAAYPDKNLSLMQLFLLLEVIGNVFLLVLSCLMPFLYFRRRDLFPRTMVFLLAFNILFVLADYLLADALFNVHTFTDNLKDIIQTALVAIIWIPYLRISHRVKHTFVIPYDEEA